MRSKSKQPQAWREVKAKIVLRYGTISELARKIGCSERAIRMAATTAQCPDVRLRMETLLPNL